MKHLECRLITFLIFWLLTISHIYSVDLAIRVSAANHFFAGCVSIRFAAHGS